VERLRPISFVPSRFPAMHYVYVLYSFKDQRLYKRSTSDISKRLLRHNLGSNRSTALKRPFVLVHVEAFADRSTPFRGSPSSRRWKAVASSRFFCMAKGYLTLTAGWLW